MARDYCCCAIPIINFGIYATLVEQFVVAAVAGTLAIGTPSIVSYNAPSFGPLIFAAACYVLAAVQIFGFVAVHKQKAALFGRYTPLHGFLTLVAFAIAGAFIGVSASNHSKAVVACQRNFYATPDDPEGTKDEAQAVCNIFAWVGIGCMGGLWIFLGIMQIYFYSVVSAYGSTQRADKAKYHNIQSANNHVAGGPNDIQLAERSGKTTDPWDTRPSTSADVGGAAGRGAHGRQNSQPHARQDSYGQTQPPHGRQNSYGQPQPHGRQNSYGQPAYQAAGALPAGAAAPRSRQPTVDQYSDPYAPQQYGGQQYGYDYNAYGAYPPAHVAAEAPTPGYGAYGVPQRADSVATGGATLVAPEQPKYHPAEGSFGRKTPRAQEPYAFKSEYAHSMSSHDANSVRRG